MIRSLRTPAPRWCVIAIAALALALGTAAQQPRVSTDKLKQHAAYLAGPKMKGRGTGSAELNKAAEYIAREFKRARLEPLNGRSFYQTFQVTVGAKLGRANRAEAAVGPEKLPLKVEQDYLPLNFSDNGEASVGVVFAGYGITANEHRYDDYLHMDVTGKAVIVLRQEPQKDDEKSVFDGRQPTQHSQIVNKAINARNHGARVLVLVNDTPAANEPDTLLKFGSLTGPDNAGLLLIQAKRATVDRWLAPSGRNLADLQKLIDEKLTPQSFYLNDVTLSLKVDVQRIMATTQNVAGVLRGADPNLAGEAVIIGAHYDHLGLGEKNSLAPSQAGKVHPGADDNASGTSVLLEMVRVFGERRKELKRSVVFLAFSGEELGLLGSAYFTKNPLWPLDKSVAMLNFDMVGRPRENKLYVGGMGTSPVFTDLMEKANAETKFALSFQQSGYGSSDHSSFYVKNLPVLFFFSGLHADYHKPSDTPEKLQYADMARVAELGMNAAQALLVMDPRPQFVRVQEERPVGGGGGTGYGAYFGSIPDMGEEVAGVKFADVRDGSPAAKAGLKAGDVLVEFAGKEIKNLYDFTFALRQHRPGETVRVVVLRGGQKVIADVKLETRR